MRDLLQFHRAALQTSVEIVNLVRPDQLGLPTPCSAWDLGDLLAHMVAQNHGFAAAARGEHTDLATYEPRPVDADPARLHATSAADLAAAFAAAGFPEREVFLAEVRGGVSVPAQVAAGFHLVDCVVHAWDVARSIDVPVSFEPPVLAAALAFAEQVPDGPQREAPGMPFRPGLPFASDAPQFDRILALLGRSPSWPV